MTLLRELQCRQKPELARKIRASCYSTEQICAEISRLYDYGTHPKGLHFSSEGLSDAFDREFGRAAYAVRGIRMNAAEREPILIPNKIHNYFPSITIMSNTLRGQANEAYPNNPPPQRMRAPSSNIANKMDPRVDSGLGSRRASRPLLHHYMYVELLSRFLLTFVSL